MINKKIYIFFIYLILSGCTITTQDRNNRNNLLTETTTPIISATNIKNTEQPVNTITPTLTLNPTNNQTVQPSETISPDNPPKDNTSYPTPILGSTIIQKCIKIKSNQTNNKLFTGTLILNSNIGNIPYKPEAIYLLNLSNRNISLLTESDIKNKGIPTSQNISPDGRWFFYFNPSAAGNTPDPRFVWPKWPYCCNGVIHVSTLGGQEPTIADWNGYWGEIVSWLDDNSLVIFPPVDNWADYGSSIIFDPFSGNWQSLSPEFPSGLNTYNLFVAYNADLTRAVYLSGSYLVLMDITTQKDLWRKQINNSPINANWSPDGSRFIFANTDVGINKYDLFIVTKDGVENQITDLANAYPSTGEIIIDNMQWSPNSQTIAFRVSFVDKANGNKTTTLMVINVDTKKIIDYCIEASSFVWSPNKEQLIIASHTKNQNNITPTPQGNSDLSVIALDIDNGIVEKLIANMEPLGWMVSP